MARDDSSERTSPRTRTSKGERLRGPNDGLDPASRLRSRLLGGGSIALAIIAAILVGRSVARMRESPAPEASASAAASSAPEAPARPSRCKEVAPDALVIGDPSPPKPKAEDDAGAEGAIEDDVDELSPFAVEIGRGIVYGGGFAASVLRDAEGGTAAFVATLGLDGKGGKLVRIGRARGDLNAPVIASAGDALLLAMIEPHASGRAIRIAKVAGENVTWGPELSEGQDESLAVDLAASADRAVITWDDLPKDSKTSRVFAITMDLATLKTSGAPRALSSADADSENPRVVARPGGFWLAYIARAEAQPPEGKPASGNAAKPVAPQAAPPKSHDRAADDEVAGGETIERSWVEIAPLDETGAPNGPARAITPKDGHVLAFDLDVTDDGAALLAWRDDDTPSGSSGGKLGTTMVRLGGAVEQHAIPDEGLPAGVPDLLPGWIAVPDAAGATRLGALGDKGELVGGFDAEPLLRGAEPLAGTKDALLIARPAGKAMRLSILQCSHDPK